MSINPTQAEVLIQQLRVLVVDDNPFMRCVVRSLLTNIGVKKIIEASDGIAALDRIHEDVPDVIILDWEMPLLNGPELVRIVRSPRRIPDAGHSHHHAQRACRALAHSRIGQARRE